MPQKEISISQLTQALLDNNKPFPPTFLNRFSDLTFSDLNEIKKIWPKVSEERKINLLEDLENLNDTDTLVDFSDLSRFLLTDPLPSVRATAMRILWETQDNKLIPTYLGIMNNDSDDVVRATAATSLGYYVYLGELEEVAPAAISRVEDALLKKINGTDSPLVRRRALESMGFSSRNEVPPLLKKYLSSSDKDWIASALFAIGRSADPQWEQNVLELIHSPEPDIQLEAIRATGGLELNAARQPLLDMLEDAEELDDEVRMAVIWSLSLIGGEAVRETLDKLAEACEDEDELEFIEQAVDNLELSDGLLDLDFLAVAAEDEDDLENIIDLEEEKNQDDNGASKPKSKKTKK